MKARGPLGNTEGRCSLPFLNALAGPWRVEWNAPGSQIPPASMPKTAPKRRRPARVEPLMPLALAVVAGIMTDRYLGPWGTAVWLQAAVAFGLIGMASARRTWVGRVAILGAFAALAGGWHHSRWSDLAGDDLTRAVDASPRPVWVRGVLREVQGFRPGAGDGSKGTTRGLLDITSFAGAGGWHQASGRAVFTVIGDRTDLRAGRPVEAAGTLAAVAPPLNPGEFDYRAYLRAQRVRLRLTVDGESGVWVGPDGPWSAARTVAGLLGAIRAWSQERLTRQLDPGVAPLATALLLGRREGVDPDVNDAFARTGTTHLLAISGLHMQVLALALGWVLLALGFGRRPTFAAVGVATVVYALLVGLMPSVVRSAVMTLTYCGAGWSDRHGRSGNVLALAALFTLGLNPAHLFDAGCQLSFLAVGAIVWLVKPVNGWLIPAAHPDPLTELERKFQPRWRRTMRRAWAGLVKGLALSAVLWIVAVPLVALRFNLISPVGVVLNVPLIPLTSLALLASGLALGLSAVWSPLGRPAAWVCARSLEWTEAIVRWGAGLRWGHVFVPEPPWGWVLGFYLSLGLATAAVLGRWRCRKVAAGLFAGCTALGFAASASPWVIGRAAGPPRVEVLAVGHGLAVVVETGGGRALLYDCGQMRNPTVGRLDAVILSHADSDHYSGLPDLLDRVPIDAVLVPEGFAGEANPGAGELLKLVRSRGIPVRAVFAGDTWVSGATRFLVRHPREGWNPTEPDNARSVVLDVSWRGRHALLTGDLDGDAPEGPIDVFLAPHHGGRSANPEWLYDWAKPTRVVVSQRAPQPGARDALAPLDARKLPVYRTWRRGAVRMTWTDEGVVARGFLDDHPTSGDETFP